MTFTEFQTSMQAQGYTAVVPVEREAGFALPVHSHDFDAEARIISGDITLGVVGASAQTYQVGDIFRLPAGTPHTETVGASGVTYWAARREILAS
ncbi:MAG: cupin [Pseudomonadota bacterium]